MKKHVCNTCGYKATELAGYNHCPLCLQCEGCKKKVKTCTCIEGE